MAKKSTQGAAPAAQPETTAPAKPPAEPLAEANGVKQPRAGGKTRMVWDFADYLRSQNGGNCPYLEDVRNAVHEYNAGKGAEDPIGKGTIEANFLLWRKFHGLKSPGRKPAPPKAEAATEAA